MRQSRRRRGIECLLSTLFEHGETTLDGWLLIRASGIGHGKEYDHEAER